MAYCRRCGASVDERWYKCQNCGEVQVPQPQPPFPQQVNVVQKGPWAAIGWILLIIILVVLVFLFFVCGGAAVACASIGGFIPLGLVLARKQRDLAMYRALA